MGLKTRSFDFKEELVKWVNEHGISKENIVDIVQDKDGMYVLWYFE